MVPDKAASIAIELSLLAGLCLADRCGLPTGEPIGRGEPIGTGIKLASSLAMKSSITSGAVALAITNSPHCSGALGAFGCAIRPIGVRYG